MVNLTKTGHLVLVLHLQAYHRLRMSTRTSKDSLLKINSFFYVSNSQINLKYYFCSFCTPTIEMYLHCSCCLMYITYRFLVFFSFLFISFFVCVYIYNEVVCLQIRHFILFLLYSNDALWSIFALNCRKYKASVQKCFVSVQKLLDMKMYVFYSMFFEETLEYIFFFL